MIVGRAVATMVELSIAVKSAASRPVIASRIWRCDIGSCAVGRARVGSATVVLM